MKQALRKGSVLDHGKYRVESVLGQGGFGITYLATDMTLERLVAIKEFFPKDFCDRDGGTTSEVKYCSIGSYEIISRLKERFIKEAKNIAKFSHLNIVKIHTVFEENNSAYFVMDYIEGQNLNSIVKESGPLSEKKALDYIYRIGEALEYIHSHHMTHFDVKPSNIIIRDYDEVPVLIDFGLSKQYSESGEAISTLLQAVSNGYSPIEMYTPKTLTSFSPQTDVYSLGATLYYMVTGQTPPTPNIIDENNLNFPVKISRFTKEIIETAMAFKPSDRYSSINEFIEDIYAKDSRENKNRWLWIVIFGLLVSSIILAIIGNITDNNNSGTNAITRDLKHTILPSIEELEKNANVQKFNLNWNNATDEQKRAILMMLSNMVYVEGGTYDKGTNVKDENNVKERITVGSFWLNKYEVTQDLWKSIMGSINNYQGDQYPISHITYTDALNFIDKINHISGLSLRLPTEAEWEFAARGGNKRGFETYRFSGSNNADDVAWYTDNSNFSIHPVGQKKPNQLGIYDMSGNVSEGTLLGNFGNQYSDSPQDRGGSFISSSDNGLKITYRKGLFGGYINITGIRLAM